MALIRESCRAGGACAEPLGNSEYQSRFGRWLSVDWSSVPALVPYANLTNPQTLSLYAMVADDPESVADLDRHELIRLGQHSDDEIKKRKQEIKEELKDKDLTKEQKEALKKERTTLDLEQQGNHEVGQMLANLDKTGERNGLTLENFTLTTDTKHDFPDATPAQIRQFLKDEAFAGAGTTIHLRTEARTVYDRAQTNQDWSFFGSSMLRHEQVHVGGFGETMAYQAQIFVFGKFKNLFSGFNAFRRIRCHT